MYVHVKLLKGYKEPLLYKIPETLRKKVFLGSILHVPLRARKTTGVVIKIHTMKPTDAHFQIKSICDVLTFPADKLYTPFLEKIASFYFTQGHVLYQRIQTFLTSKKESGIELEPENIEHQFTTSDVQLTDEQQQTVDYITNKVDQQQFAPSLLHGVTGSGKTEVYKKIIEHCFTQNKTTLLLLPEVSLSMQFEKMLRAQLADSLPLFSFHSATKAQQRRELWHHLVTGKPCLIIGVHLPIFLPIINLGCILVDEEHETGFQEKKHPKINSKQAALLRAQLLNIPILLGSATPSLTSLAQVDTGKWKLFSITKRFAGSFPEIRKVLLDTKKKRDFFWISDELKKAISQQLARNEQTILYLNRRGYSFFVQCKQCTFIFECSNCSVSLTLHKNQRGQTLRCHYCDYHISLPTQCPECKVGEKEFLKKGVGTQQLTSMVEKMFPTARVARADLDTTKKKRVWQETVEQFKQGQIDIIIGTQLITKGYHFPNVTLVGVIWADLNLHFPQYDASETTLQKLIQVAGRAGRSDKKSSVIVQALKDHPVFQFINEEEYISFVQTEKDFRKQTGYPPFKRLISIELKNSDVDVLDSEADKLADRLRQLCSDIGDQITILGPTQPMVARVAKTETRLIYLKSTSFSLVHALADRVETDSFSSSVHFVPIG